MYNIHCHSVLQYFLLRQQTVSSQEYIVISHLQCNFISSFTQLQITQGAFQWVFSLHQVLCFNIINTLHSSHRKIGLRNGQLYSDDARMYYFFGTPETPANNWPTNKWQADNFFLKKGFNQMTFVSCSSREVKDSVFTNWQQRLPTDPSESQYLNNQFLHRPFVLVQYIGIFNQVVLFFYCICLHCGLLL